jgi:hypothetical protein
VKHLATSRFWRCYHALPAAVRELADRSFGLLKADPKHPSLRFKKVGTGEAVCLPTAANEGRAPPPPLTPRRQPAMFAQPVRRRWSVKDSSTLPSQSSQATLPLRARTMGVILY